MQNSIRLIDDFYIFVVVYYHISFGRNRYLELIISKSKKLLKNYQNIINKNVSAQHDWSWRLVGSSVVVVRLRYQIFVKRAATKLELKPERVCFYRKNTGQTGKKS